MKRKDFEELCGEDMEDMGLTEHFCEYCGDPLDDDDEESCCSACLNLEKPEKWED